ncbi:MAG: excinuclease ABC subunit UvrC, partial [Actinobacteria bacterium]|nr:excinuclease ABC subunit UvrC [Actinomycetota bacterium]
MENIETKKNDLALTISSLPKKPGVYLFKDNKGEIIYIGKAKILYNRVRSYFLNKENLNFSNPKASYFSEKIDAIDYLVTDSEVEALILELNLIKKYRPKFNADLKDDKSYPFIAITENEDFPRLIITRNRNIRGAKYFGPYTNVHALREIAEYLRKIFMLRDCRKSKPGKQGNKPCLNFHIKLCSGPCIGKISRSEYKKNIEYIILFLKGKDKNIVKSLTDEMNKFAANLDYEKAAEIKNRIERIGEIYIGQKIYISGESAWDFIGIVKDEDMAAAGIFMYRQGELAGFNNITITNFGTENIEDIMSDFLIKYYENINNMPSIIYIPFKIEDIDMLTKYFKKTKDKKIEIKVPKTGENRSIMDMALKNCSLFLEKKKFEKESNFSKVFDDAMDLKEALKLRNIPRRIECYDISNLKESFPVGSMVVFIDGIPAKNDYRHFKIKTVTGQDDFKMMHEVLKRRLRYLNNSKIEIEESFYQKPDLIIIDGGKGQLSAAKDALLETKISEQIDLISLAKKEEIIFSDYFKNGISFDKNENFMRMIIKIRDETHRFAVEFHQKLRDKNMTKSFLDNIKGIGEKKKHYIYEKSNSLGDLKNLAVSDLADIRGLTYQDAKNIYDALHK